MNSTPAVLHDRGNFMHPISLIFLPNPKTSAMKFDRHVLEDIEHSRPGCMQQRRKGQSFDREKASGS
jgi:hypothetical protein